MTSGKSESIPVAEAVTNLLVEAGVRRAYTVPGESFLPLLDAFDRHPDIQLISTRHEGGAAFMAEADGKLTGVPAVVMATRGVGAANLAIGLHTARQDSTPMLALLGQVETRYLGNEGFQEVDLPKFLGEISAWGTTVHRSDRVAQAVARGLARATTGRPGPAVVALPSDVLDGTCAPQRLLLEGVRSVAHPEDVLDVAKMLAEAQMPVVIAGQGNDHGLLCELARAFGLGVYAAFRRQDQFPNDDEHYLGHLTLGTPKPTLAALEQSDLVLVLGERLDETTTQSYSVPNSSTRLIHVYQDPAVFGVHQRADRAINSAPADFCRQLLAVADQVRPDVGSAWWCEGHQTFLDLAAGAIEADELGRLHPGRAIDAVQSASEPGTVVVNDAGNFSVYLHRQWMFREPRTQAAPVSGAMGYAVPGAIGAALARPDRPVLAVAGDGGFLMTAVELETAVRLGVNIKVLVLQNGLYGTIAMHQAGSGRSVSACDISAVDIASLSRALGAHAIECDDDSSLQGVARELMRHDGPAVMVVRTDPDIILPGRSLTGLAGNLR